MASSCKEFKSSEDCDKECVRKHHNQWCFTACKDPTCHSSVFCGTNCTIHIPCSENFSFPSNGIDKLITHLCNSRSDESVSFRGECGNLDLRVWVQNKTQLCQPRNETAITGDCKCKKCISGFPSCKKYGKSYCGCEVTENTIPVSAPVTEYYTTIATQDHCSSITTNVPEKDFISTTFVRPTTDGFEQHQLAAANKGPVTSIIGGAIGGSIGVLLLALFLIVLIRVRFLKKSRRKKNNHTSASFSNRDYDNENILPYVGPNAIVSQQIYGNENLFGPEDRVLSSGDVDNLYANSRNVSSADDLGATNKDNYFVLDKDDNQDNELVLNVRITTDKDSPDEFTYNMLNEKDESQDGEDMYHHVKSTGGLSTADLQDYDHIQKQFERQDKGPDDVYDHCKNTGPDDEYMYAQCRNTDKFRDNEHNDYDHCKLTQQKLVNDISAVDSYGNLL